jgi:hypothetical protein
MQEKTIEARGREDAVYTYTLYRKTREEEKRYISCSLVSQMMS